jgi:hypothetical protein
MKNACVKAENAPQMKFWEYIAYFLTFMLKNGKFW